MSYRRNDDRDDRMKPIDKWEDVATYMENPPQWGRHAKPLVKRSKAVKNSDIISCDQFCHVNIVNPDSTVEPPRHDIGAIPKTLICHDMKNGYLDDSYVNGTEDYTAYHFYHWSSIDIFCYFSHHFITIPPLGWINAAHNHGVKIIGTIITEWRDGYELCEKILENEDSYKSFAQHITAIAKYHRLDGWLLNIENTVRKPERLGRFISYLKHKMHEEIPGSQLIWYDSVTVKGSLKWQNQLNDQNMEFFKASDGIFLNYSWYEEDLKTSQRNAGDRWNDVYVGVDVWGRNFWGGGQFNTVEALNVIKKYNLSLAIFAFAWTHETISIKELVNDYTTPFVEEMEPVAMANVVREVTEKRRAADRSLQGVPNSEAFIKNAFFKEFLLRENAFWNQCWPFLYSHCLTSLPFETSFCRGQGEKKWQFGEIVDERPWFNLTDTQYQIGFPQCGLSHDLVIIDKSCTEKKKNEEKASDTNEHKTIEETVAAETKEATSLLDNNDSNLNNSANNKSITDDTSTRGKNLKREASQSPRQSVVEAAECDDFDESKTSCLDKVASLLRVKRSKGGTRKEDHLIKVKTDDLDTNASTKTGSRNLQPDHNADSSKVSNEVLPKQELSSSNEILESIDEDVKSALNVLDGVTREAEENVTVNSTKIDHNVTEQQQGTSNTASDPHNSKPPVVRRKAVPSGIRPCFEPYYSDSFNGGSSIIVQPPEQPTPDSNSITTPNDTRIIHRLFISEIDCKASLIIYYITKNLPGHEDQSLHLILKMKSNHTGVINTIVLSGKEWDNGQTRSSYEHQADYVIYPINRTVGQRFKKVQNYLLKNHEKLYVPDDNEHGWKVKYYTVEYPETTLIEMQCELGESSAGPILLGSLGLCSGPP